MKERIQYIRKLISKRDIDPTFLTVPIYITDHGQAVLEAQLGSLDKAISKSAKCRFAILKKTPQIFAHLIHGLYQLHKNDLVHHDISLNNVLVYEYGNQYIFKLSDLDETCKKKYCCIQRGICSARLEL